MVQLEPYQLVWIDADSSFSELDPVHGAIGCVTCHGGVEPVIAASDGTDDMWIAMAEAHGFEVEYDATGDVVREKPEHTEMAHDPSVYAENNCNGLGCHAEVVELNANSMHTQLWGEKHKVSLRAGYESWDQCPQSLTEKYNGECTNCHTTCGQCHISRPNSVHGGFLDSHRFQRTPSVENNCTACHGSRVGNDFNGAHAGNQPDVHKELGFDCFFCHTEDLHGDGRTDYTSRYEVEGIPQCKDCHSLTEEDNLFHKAHWPGGNYDGDDLITGAQDGLSCYVCHSQPYTSCLNCHSGGVWSSDSPEGYAEYTDFKIGYNSGSWANHPQDEEPWVLVRHIPVIKDGFREWGWPQLYNWSAFETWEFASPHSIQRYTPQTAVALEDPTYDIGNCWINCHVQGPNEELNANRFLWLSHVDSLKHSITGIENDPDEYVRANRHVTVDDSISVFWPRY